MELLTNKTAQLLYRDYAEKMPIFDYHCHIDPREIAEDKAFGDIAEVWLSGDHYKWRIMRANGVKEEYITGGASGHDKFRAFAETLPRAVGNPVYHWTRMELKKYFDCDMVLNPDTADEIREFCNAKLKSGLTARKIIEMSNAAAIGTTDDPADTLEWHAKIKSDNWGVAVIPTFRPDKALNADKPDFAEYVEKLGEAAGVAVTRLDDVYSALINRMDFFGSHNCRAADHGLDYVAFENRGAAEAAFTKAFGGGKLTPEELESYKAALLLFCGREYHRRGWVMQLHFNVNRSVNTRFFRSVGENTGFDCVSTRDCGGLTAFLDALDADSRLPKTILYSLNPADNMFLATVAACFPPAQNGAAWWFNDNKAGIREQLTAFANVGVLGNFIGMTTDSRSFLSYTRHEYFRRILCDFIGGLVENGEYPADIETLGGLVEDICYNNAAGWFGGDPTLPVKGVRAVPPPHTSL